MSWENAIVKQTWPAAEDLTNDQYRWVVLTASGTIRRPDGASEIPLGILQNAPVSGAEAVVAVLGFSKLQMSEIAAVSAYVGLEYVSATDAGKGKDMSGDLAKAHALVVEASGAEDDLATVFIGYHTPGVAYQAINKTTVLVDSTAGVKTYAAADIIGNMILRDPNGGARNDVFPTAAQLVAGFQGCAVGTSFDFDIRNTADAAETITMTTATGLTLSGTMTIAQNNTKRFKAVFTNVGSGTEAVTIYSIGTFVH